MISTIQRPGFRLPASFDLGKGRTARLTWVGGKRWDLSLNTGCRREFLGVLAQDELGLWQVTRVFREFFDDRSWQDTRYPLEQSFASWQVAITAAANFEPPIPEFPPQCGQCQFHAWDLSDAGVCMKSLQIMDCVAPACDEYAEAVPF